MRRIGLFTCIALFFVSSVSAHYSTSDFHAQFLSDADTYTLRAADSVPLEIPAVKETETKNNPRLIHEDCPFVPAALPSAIPCARAVYVVPVEQRHYAPLSKYRKSIISRQTVK